MVGDAPVQFRPSMRDFLQAPLSPLVSDRRSRVITPIFRMRSLQPTGICSDDQSNLSFPANARRSGGTYNILDDEILPSILVRKCRSVAPLRRISRLTAEDERPSRFTIDRAGVEARSRLPRTAKAPS
jgi:hypothetical protein